jgi:hypothetical protein
LLSKLLGLAPKCVLDFDSSQKKHLSSNSRGTTDRVP